MKIFVAGGTGAIGRPLIAKLLAKGHALGALTRSPEKAQALVQQGIEPAIANVFDPDAVKAVVSRARPEIVIQQLTALPRTDTPESMNAARRPQQSHSFGSRRQCAGIGASSGCAAVPDALKRYGGADAVYYGTQIRGVSNAKAKTRPELSAATIGVDRWLKVASLLAATHCGFAFYVAFPESSIPVAMYSMSLIRFNPIDFLSIRWVSERAFAACAKRAYTATMRRARKIRYHL